MKNSCRIFLLVLFITAAAALPAEGQFDYINLTTRTYEGAQFEILNPVIRHTQGEDMRIYCDLKNNGGPSISGVHFWILIYFGNNESPELFDYRVPTAIGAGEIRNFYWDEPVARLGKPVSGIVVPYLVEYGDRTIWSLREYYALGTPGEENQPEYPDVGFVTALVDSLGMISAGTMQDIRDGMQLAVIRGEAQSVEKIARIRTVNNYATKSGFKLEYNYPGQRIQQGDRVQLLFPGMTRLHSTSRSLLVTSALSATAGTVFYFQKHKAWDKADDADNTEDRMRHLDNKEKYDNRREAAFLTAGITASGALLSELIFGRNGGHLYPDANKRFLPWNWNTTTRSLMTTGSIALGSALYYKLRRDNAEGMMHDAGSQEDYDENLLKFESAKYKRDVSLTIAGSAIGVGLLQQFIIGNRWPGPEMQTGRTPDRWSPVTRSFILMGTTALAAGYTFQHMKLNKLNTARDEPYPDDRVKQLKDARKLGNFRDASVVMGGAVLAAGFLHEMWFRPDNDNIFKSTSPVRMPGLPKSTWYIAGFTAATSSAAFLFHSKLQDYEDSFDSATSDIDREHYQGKIDQTKANRTHAIIAASISGVSTILSYFNEKSAANNRNRSRGGGEGGLTINPEFDAFNNTARLTISF